MDLLMNAVDILPDGLPFSSMLKNITRVLASESQGNLMVQIFLLSDSVWTVRGFLDQGQLHNEKCVLIRESPNE